VLEICSCYLVLLYLFDCDTPFFFFFFFFAAAWILTLVTGVTMAMWLIKKHKKEFGKEYPRNQRAMILFIL
jgi:hypothetical protein